MRKAGAMTTKQKQKLEEVMRQVSEESMKTCEEAQRFGDYG
jgi:hypothetical protein